MSLLSGTVSLRRFRVTESPEPALTPAQISEKIREYAFQEPAQPSVEPVQGFTQFTNPYELDLDNPNHLHEYPWVFFGLRIDKRKIPTKLLNAKLDKVVTEWCEARDLERCPRTVRRELRETLEAELVRKINPKTMGYQIAWNTAENYLLIDTHTETVSDTLQRMFWRAFGVRISPWRLVDLARDEAESDELSNVCMNPTTDFLTWLWWRIEQSQGEGLAEKAETLWVDSRVVLCDPAASEKVTLTGENPSMGHEARAALVSGKRPKEIRLGVRDNDDQTYLATVRDNLDLASIAMPTVHDPEEDGWVGTLLIRLSFYELLFDILTHVGVRFVDERLDADWDTVLVELRKWTRTPHAESEQLDSFTRRHRVGPAIIEQAHLSVTQETPLG
jgi:recombination associated protein RdgC